MFINMRILAKFPLDCNWKTPKLNTNLFCELLGKKQKKRRISIAQNTTQKSNKWVKIIPKILMKQSSRIQSRKITDIIKKIVGIPVGKQNHKPGMHGFVVYNFAQVAVFCVFFSFTLGLSGEVSIIIF